MCFTHTANTFIPVAENPRDDVYWMCKMSDLKDGDERLPERVEVAARLVLVDNEVELATKQLHAEQREDDDEQEQ